MGFDACGVARAQRLDQDAAFMDQWVDAGLAGKMDYLERNRDKRYDISLLVPGAQTVIVCLLTYAHSGRDYHRTVKSKLYELQAALENALHEAGLYQEDWVNREAQHIFCDSAPVLERRWAQLAGLGFIGTNHQLIHPQLGSYVHPGELVVNIPIDTLLQLDTWGDGLASIDSPLEQNNSQFSIFNSQFCLTCGACVEACPGQALGQAVWDARKCIAYETHHCTVCQDICPFNQGLGISY